MKQEQLCTSIITYDASDVIKTTNCWLSKLALDKTKNLFTFTSCYNYYVFGKAKQRYMIKINGNPSLCDQRFGFVLFFLVSQPCSLLDMKKSINLARLKVWVSCFSLPMVILKLGQWFTKSVKTNTCVWIFFFICKNRSEISQTFLELNKGSWYLKWCIIYNPRRKPTKLVDCKIFHICWVKCSISRTLPTEH